MKLFYLSAGKESPSYGPTHAQDIACSAVDKMHIDHVEQGKKDFLIVLNAHSRWPETVPVQNTTINVLRDMFSKYGIPLQIVSDNGPQFCSVEFASLLKSNGVKHIRVAPYHATSNELAERMVQSFKHSYHSSKQDQMSMQQSIANFLLIYRSTTHPTTGYTPAKLFLGRELRTRLSLIKPETQSNVMTTQGRQKDYHDLHSKYREFYPGDAVLVKDLRKANMVAWHCCRTQYSEAICDSAI